MLASRNSHSPIRDQCIYAQPGCTPSETPFVYTLSPKYETMCVCAFYIMIVNELPAISLRISGTL